MRLDEPDIEEFRRIYNAEFDEFLSPAQAREIAARLINLYELLARPLPSEQALVLELPQPTAMLGGDAPTASETSPEGEHG